MEAIIQGQFIETDTPQVITNLLSTSFIERVIVSCWENCPVVKNNDSRVSFVRSKPHSIPGTGNRNLQIQSSLAGVRQVKSEVCAKFRSDQIISVESLELMNRFFNKFKEPQLKYADGTGPLYQMFSCGDFWPFAFHPRDHVFWSDTKSMETLFDIPYSTHTNPANADSTYRKETRSEAYIGSYYYSRFNHDVKKMIDCPIEYLVDEAQKSSEALKISNLLKDKVFKVFPRISLNWPKHRIFGYRYESQKHWERWNDETWE